MDLTTSNSGPPTLPVLPIELLREIAQDATPGELQRLLLVSKAFNWELTPVLYASICPPLLDVLAVQQCIRTLTRAPHDLAFGRNYAALVRSFTIPRILMRDPSKQERERKERKLMRRLLRAIEAMIGLRHLRMDHATCSPQVFKTLVRSGPRSLRSLDFSPHFLGDIAPMADGSSFDMLLDLYPVFPELVALTIDLSKPDSDNPWVAPLVALLENRAAHLRKLKLHMREATLVRVFQKIPAWSQLQELTITADEVPLALFPPAPNLRKLKIIPIGRVEMTHIADLPQDALPNLEILVCPYYFLPVFLPDHPKAQRPIRTIRLDGAFHDEVNRSGSYCQFIYQAWEDIVEVLRCVSRSTGPVTDLGFCIGDLDMGRISEIAISCGNVERLVVITDFPPKNEADIARFGETLFSHTPNLHTFILSEYHRMWFGASDPPGTFPFARDVTKQLSWLDSWDKTSNVLQRVAFTRTIIWDRHDAWRSTETPEHMPSHRMVDPEGQSEGTDEDVAIEDAL
ncbi:hypothetical protein C8Q77DRAFT_1133920 [Trametes polyzona]|nr:hypothetical protein C8Q77DRAFT_1133920 [Trametes polyzona]